MRLCEPVLDLRTATFVAQAPFAEVLAIIREQSIAVLAEPRTSAEDHFRAVKARLHARTHPDGVPMSKARERNLFYRSALPASGESRIVDDLAGAHVDAVMGVATARRD